VIAAVVLAIPVGIVWGEGAKQLEILPQLIIRAVTALAAPLVVLAILSAIVGHEVRGRQGLRMMVYYLINTLVAMGFGLLLVNVFQPGVGADLASAEAGGIAPAKKSLRDLFIELIPRSVGDAFATNNLAQLVLLTLALGIALAKIRDEQRARGQTTYRVAIDLLNLGFELWMRVLLWVVAWAPLAVFGVVAASVGRHEGIQVFRALIGLVAVVLAGLACQVMWYLGVMAVVARMPPARFLRGAADVMASTFSTSSTAATIPITLQALMQRLGVSRASSQLAACVGTNFNNDGTALYQATAALFMAQALGYSLGPIDQVIIVLTTLVASVGAGGIPSGSFVTLPLIFAAVGLPADQIPVLLTVDWFLDRCRTTSNVLGDMTVAVLLDRTAEPSNM
jgi:DAACS family dicarboxylate/amino acid:cation (Na+ or H+) symporter